MTGDSSSEQSLQARAQIAYQRGDNDALERLEEALAMSPDWVRGHRALVQLKTELGIAKPFETLEAALRHLPDHPKLWLAYLALLGSGGKHVDAARHANALQKRIGPVPGLRLIEARNAGLAGEVERAQTLLCDLPDGLPELHYELARNALRMGDFRASSEAIERGLADDASDIRLWALAEICWRVSSGERHDWLVRGGALHEQVSLGLTDNALTNICELLRGTHSTRAAPLGQSVRGGTQTRGDLRELSDEGIADLFRKIDQSLVQFCNALPKFEARHPLASLKTGKPIIKASWSIRLTDGGNHVAHLHDSGLVSSALHLAIPAPAGEGEGVLELGRPPADLNLNLEPLATYQPLPGHLVLFPSFLYHGTTPFPSGERLTVAFDAA